MTGTTAVKEVELVSIGNGVGFLLTPEMLANLGIETGDTVSVQTTPTGIRITPGPLAVARRIMREDRDVLRRLAE